MTCKIGWFSTGRGAGSYGLLQAVQSAIMAGELDARIEFVYCSRERGETEATDAYLDLVESKVDMAAIRAASTELFETTGAYQLSLSVN